MTVNFDLDRFWEENRASEGRPFCTDKPRAPLSLPFDDHWLIEEMELPSTLRYYRDPAYRAEVNRQCNDRVAEAIGLRPFPESVASPPLRRIEQVLGARIELTEGGTPWLEPAVQDIEELRHQLCEWEAVDDVELWARMVADGAIVDKLDRMPDGALRSWPAFSRGPATIATSVLGTAPLLFWMIDYPDEMHRFYGVLTDLLIRSHRLFEQASGMRYRGYRENDDNCALLSPALYGEFCLPMLQRLFAEFAPNPADVRFQHSDSEMTHLLPILAPLGFHAVNLGPTIPTQVIRRHMPRTEIHGQVAPFTLRNGTDDDIVAEVRRDFAAVGADGGLLVTTAGSIAAGTRLTSIRMLMWAVQTYCRHDGKSPTRPP